MCNFNVWSFDFGNIILWQITQAAYFVKIIFQESLYQIHS